MTAQSPIHFPTDFTLKIMGKCDEDNSVGAQGQQKISAFEQRVHEIVRVHFSDYRTDKKLSENAHYLSLSITVHAKTKAALDALYRDLSKESLVLMTL